MHQEKNRQRLLPSLRRSHALAKQVERDLAFLSPVFAAPDFGGRLRAGCSSQQTGTQTDADAGNYLASGGRLVSDGHIANEPITAAAGEQTLALMDVVSTLVVRCN